MPLSAKARKFTSLPASDRWLLLHTALLLTACRVAVWLFPMRALRRLLALATRPPRHARKSVDDDKLAWAIATASPYAARATCLTQAMAAYVFLARSGRQPVLRIGVRKSRDNGLAAHAWVEQAGRVVVGRRPDLPAYAQLLTIESAS